ncbi:DUF6541 family protein [Oryzobacter sp. R7]|uniref:DUF6541 family protein n=1 Tax=Oryzobacter faecalis TaxID=3388656 RepID=UPI00398D0BF6
MSTAVAVLVVPGALVAWAAGLRGVLVAGVAPLLSVAVTAVAAVVTPWVGLRWGAAAFGLGLAGAAGVAGSARWMVQRRWPLSEPAPGDPAASWAGLVVGLAAGGAALASGVERGLGSPERWPQTFDAVFHLDAVWHVLRTGDGSSLTLAAMTRPESTRGFYPAAWHDLVALVAGVTGADVVVATAATSMAVVAVAWPLGCTAVTRVAAGASGPLLAAAGALSAAVSASPVLLVSYGTLWPNALGTAVLPAALAVGVAVLRPPSGGRPAAGAVLVIGFPGLALAHPNAVVSLLVLGTAAAFALRWSSGRPARAVLVAWALLLGWLVAWSPVFAATRQQAWPARQTTGQAVGEWLTLSPERTPVPLVVVGFLAVGVVVAGRSPRLRWLLAVHAVGGGLFVLVAGSDGRVARWVSGPWWDDPYRLGALVAVAAVPLAAVGLRAVAGWAADHLPAAAGRGRREAVVAGVLLVGTAVLSGGLYRAETASTIERWAGREDMLGPAERELVAGVGHWVPEGERVAGNPFDGLAFTGPLADREAVFPHTTGRWGADRELLASSLASVATRPDVCAALDRLRVRHVLDGQSRFWTDDLRRPLYAGLEVAGRPGFEEVARGGSASLWRVTACG